MKPGRHFNAFGARGRFRAAARAATLGLALLGLVACQQAAPPATPVNTAPGATAPPTATAPPAPAAPTVAGTPATKMPSLDFAPGPLYLCDVAGNRTPVEYDSKVEKLCRRHPEMGPCQYERNICRAKGGRVYTQKGEEVTLAVESEYDRVVRRVRFQADAGTPAKSK